MMRWKRCLYSAFWACKMPFNFLCCSYNNHVFLYIVIVDGKVRLRGRDLLGGPTRYWKPPSKLQAEKPFKAGKFWFTTRDGDLLQCNPRYAYSGVSAGTLSGKYALDRGQGVQFYVALMPRGTAAPKWLLLYPTGPKAATRVSTGYWSICSMTPCQFQYVSSDLHQHLSRHRSERPVSGFPAREWP